jgi:putative transposase
VLVKEIIVLFLHLLTRVATLLGTSGRRTLLAENLLLQQQLLVWQRSRRRAPNLGTIDRLFFGFWTLFLRPRRLVLAAIILKPSTRLRFHRGLKQIQYRLLYSSRPKRKPGPKGPTPELIYTFRQP